MLMPKVDKTSLPENLEMNELAKGLQGGREVSQFVTGKKRQEKL